MTVGLKHFDVFLSHDPASLAGTLRLAERLRAAGLQPWLDSEQLAGQLNHVDEEAVIAGLRASSACAICVGPDFNKNWGRAEIRLAVNRALNDQRNGLFAKGRAFRIFLVWLPGLPDDFDVKGVPGFLREFPVLDLRQELDAASFQQVVLTLRGHEAAASGDISPATGLTEPIAPDLTEPETDETDPPPYFLSPDSLRRFGKGSDKMAEPPRRPRRMLLPRSNKVLGEEVSGEPPLHEKKQPLSRRLLAVTGGLLVVFMVAAILAWTLADSALKQKDAAQRESNSAEQQAKQAVASDLTAQGNGLLKNNDLELASLLALEANKVLPDNASEDLMRQILLSPMPRLLQAGNGNDINRMAFSPDGKYFATLSTQRANTKGSVLQLWDAASQRAVKLADSTASPNGLVFSPDSKTLLVLYGVQPRLYEVPGGKFTDLTIPGGNVLRAIFSPDGRYLATTNAVGQSFIVEVRTKQVRPLLATSDANGRVYSTGGSSVSWQQPEMAFSPDGSRIALIQGGAIKILDVATTNILQELKLPDISLLTMAWSPDNNRIVAGATDGTVRMWVISNTVPTPSQLQPAHNGWVRKVGYSTDGSTVLSYGDDQTVYRHDPNNNRAFTTSSTRSSNATNIWPVWSRDGRLIASVVEGGIIRIESNEVGQRVLTLRGGGDNLAQMEFSPDGKALLTASTDGSLRWWNTTSSRPSVTDLSREFVASNTDSQISQDGRFLATTSNARAKLWDAQTGRLIASLDGPDKSVNKVAFSPDSKLLLVSYLDFSIGLWSTENGSEVIKLKGVDSAVLDINFSLDTKLVVTGHQDKTARIWNVADGRLLNTLTDMPERVNSVRFSPDNTLVATASQYGAYIWRVSDGARLAQIKHDSWVNSVRFSPDSKTLVSSSNDNSVKVWEATTSREILNLKDLTATTRMADFSPDGKNLLTFSADNQLRFWNVADGSLRQTVGFSLSSNVAPSYRFSADGKLLLLAGGFGLRILNAQTGTTYVDLLNNGSFSFYAYQIDSITGAAGFGADGKTIVSLDGRGQLRSFDCDICGTPTELANRVKSRLTRELTPAERQRYLHTK